MKKLLSFITCSCIGVFIGLIFMEMKKIESERKIQSRCDKFLNYYTMLNLWMKIKNQNRSLSEFLIQNNYKNIAVYGMGEMGQRLCEELIHSNINIAYAIDKKTNEQFPGIPMKRVEEAETVDLIIVTATYEYETIKKELEKSVTSPIISLNEIVFSLRN